jgi:hypothetical protein
LAITLPHCRGSFPKKLSVTHISEIGDTLAPLLKRMYVDPLNAFNDLNFKRFRIGERPMGAGIFFKPAR